MIIGATSFIIHNDLFKDKINELLKNFEFRFMMLLIGVSFLLSLYFIRSFKVSLFEIVSAFTTTGFTITNVRFLPAAVVSLIFTGMIIGGSLASTAGGIKLFRFGILLKSVTWMIKKLSNPSSAVIPFRIQKKPVEETVVLATQIFVTTYLFLLFCGATALMLSGYSMFDSFFQTASALGTVGLQSISLANANIVVKTVLMIAMLLGRLEIFPFLVLFNKLLRH